VVQASFNNVSALKSITFEGVCPVFVKDSYYGMFADLPADCIIYVPDDQIDAYKAAFADREDVLARIQPSGKNAIVIDWTAPESDFQFDASTGTITGYTGTASRIDIPASIGGVAVKHIGSQAFLQKYNLMYVTIPEGVETIEKQAFHGCTLMTYVSLPTTLHTLGDSAFNSCNLVEVGWSEGLESVGTKAFYNCDIAYATLPATLRTIADSGFENAGFEDLTFGPNVETVGEKGFAGRRLVSVAYTGSAMPVFGADAFKDNTKDATLTLPDGCTRELYDSFVSYMADAFPTCVVNEPANMEMPFPALDVMAGMPFFGSWNSVAGKDVMGEFTDDYPVTAAVINPDGTAVINANGEEKTCAWYVTEGYALFAPVVDGKASEADVFVFGNIDENGRLVMDFGYAAAICEQEGKVYAVPAIPERPWPEFDLSYGRYFVGSWQTADGSMLLTLNDDGTATSAEPGEEPYELHWYADYAEAFVGETVNTAASVTFDGAGNIVMKMGDDEITLAPYVEPVVIEGADELLGDWYDDIGNKLTIVNDGTLTYTYASDGWVNEDAWNVVDGAAVVLEGSWEGCPITLENGILTIANGEGIFQIFSVDGDLSAYYAAQEPEMPEPQPIGAEGEAFFGEWKLESMMGMDAASMGMEMILTLNEDGTCALYDGYENDENVWVMENGQAIVDGSPLYVNDEGKLVMSQEGMEMIFVSNGETESAPVAAQPIGAEGEAFFGEWKLESMMGMDAASMGMEMILTLNEDGTCALYDGYESDENVWAMENGQAIVDGSPLYVNDEGRLVMSQEGMEMIFVKAEAGDSADESDEMSDEELLALLALLAQMEGSEGETAPEVETAPEGEDPYIGVKYVLTGASINGINLSAEQLNAAGDYVIFNADGSVELCMSDRMVETLGWTRGPVTVMGAEHDGFCVDYYGTYYNFGITGDGLMLDYFGTPRFYEAEGGAAEENVAEPAATEVPAPTDEPAAGFSSYEDYMDIKFVAKTYTSFGNTLDASTLGAEYAVTFHANGTCDFVMAGVPASGLSWGLQEVAVGLNKTDAFVINYYGVTYNCLPTAAGFDMDFYGTMNLHFVPAE